MDLEQVIKTRRSIRKYKTIKIQIQDIMEILENVIWAPSAHNSMPYYFLIIESPEIKTKLSKQMAEVYIKDLKKDKISVSQRSKIIEDSLKKFTSPPILIIPCLSMERMHKYPDRKRQNAEYTMAIQSVSAAIQNLLLASHARGFGCCWYCAPLFCQDVIRKVLHIPKSYDPQAIITFGYPDENPKPPARLQVEKITFKDNWGQKI
ncbi:MAG: nitroreductase family protein [Candidatus Helarchaeota archaeon]